MPITLTAQRTLWDRNNFQPKDEPKLSIINCQFIFVNYQFQFVSFSPALLRQEEFCLRKTRAWHLRR